MTETAHLGKKISRVRELRGMKQETLAEQLGISQQAISKIEQSENVEDVTLGRIAKALGVPPEAIKNFSEEATMYYFNTFNDNSINQGVNSFRDSSSFILNPIEKWLEALAENKRLYEALLKEKDEKIALLQKLAEKK